MGWGCLPLLYILLSVLNISRQNIHGVQRLPDSSEVLVRVVRIPQYQSGCLLGRGRGLGLDLFDLGKQGIAASGRQPCWGSIREHHAGDVVWPEVAFSSEFTESVAKDRNDLLDFAALGP